MSSHWDWAKRVEEEHNASKPFAPENGQALKFKAGDKVIYTNSYGVTFHQTVTGLYTDQDSFYHRGYRYTLDYDCYWMPVKESDLQLDE